MSIGETRTALDTVLWKELPLAQDMAAGVPAIRANLRGSSLFRETSEEEMSLRTAVLRGQLLAVRRDKSGSSACCSLIYHILGQLADKT